MGKVRSGVALGMLLAAGVFAASGGRGGVMAQPAAEAVEDYPELPGRDETFSFCTGCHNFKLVAAQGMNREAWNDTLDWMVKRQGMADIQGEPRQTVLDYLAEAFPAGRKAQPGAWQNPFSQ